MPKTVQFTQGSIIFFEGDKDSNIYILQSGAVALKSRDLETGVQISEQVRIGEFFGVKSALAHMPSLVTASVLVNSVVVSMTVAEFEKLFSAKQAITEKMLRVFSKSLRDIHRKTEDFLKSGFIAISPEVGMLTVAKAFFNDEQYKSCVDVLIRISQINSNPSNKAEIEKLYREARRRVDSSRSGRAVFATEAATATSSGLAVNQFSLPAFDRFTKKYSRGDVIISEFEPGETFYLIKYGEVQICKCIKDQNKSLDILTSGSFFGEMAILDNSQRSASCVARTDVACLEFNKANFKALVLSNPQIVMNLLKIFTKRIYLSFSAREYTTSTGSSRSSSSRIFLPVSVMFSSCMMNSRVRHQETMKTIQSANSISLSMILPHGLPFPSSRLMKSFQDLLTAARLKYLKVISP